MPVKVAVAPGAPFAEGFVELDPGQLFDRVTIVSDDPAKEFAINHFEVCSEVIVPGDLVYDGDVDVNDVPPSPSLWLD